jgi:hypothetical protein
MGYPADGTGTGIQPGNWPCRMQLPTGGIAPCRHLDDHAWS